jgi:hypothetical protein
MVLMSIVAAVRQDQIGIDSALEALEPLLDRGALEWKEAILESSNFHVERRGAAQKAEGAALGFACSARVAAEDDPVNGDASARGDQTEKRTAATDFEVIGMGAEAKQRQWAPPRQPKRQR